jgi:hypothetical protein
MQRFAFIDNAKRFLPARDVGIPAFWQDVEYTENKKAEVCT